MIGLSGTEDTKELENLCNKLHSLSEAEALLKLNDCLSGFASCINPTAVASVLYQRVMNKRCDESNLGLLKQIWHSPVVINPHTSLENNVVFKGICEELDVLHSWSEVRTLNPTIAEKINVNVESRFSYICNLVERVIRMAMFNEHESLRVHCLKLLEEAEKSFGIGHSLVRQQYLMSKRVETSKPSSYTTSRKTRVISSGKELDWLRSLPSLNGVILNCSILEELNTLADLIKENCDAESSSLIMGNVIQEIVRFAGTRAQILKSSTDFESLVERALCHLNPVRIKAIVFPYCKDHQNEAMTMAHLIDMHLTMLAVTIPFNAYSQYSFFERVIVLAEAFNEVKHGKELLEEFRVLHGDYIINKSLISKRNFLELDTYIAAHVCEIGSMTTSELAFKDTHMASMAFIDGANLAYQGFPYLFKQIGAYFAGLQHIRPILLVQFMAIRHFMRCFVYATTSDYDLNRLKDQNLNERLESGRQLIDGFALTVSSDPRRVAFYENVKEALLDFMAAFHEATLAKHIKFLKDYDAADNINADYYKRHGSLIEWLTKNNCETKSEKKSIEKLIASYKSSFKFARLNDCVMSKLIVQFHFHITRINYLLAEIK